MIEARVIDYLGHMLEAIQIACSYIEHLDQDGFLADWRTQQAVILNICRHRRGRDEAGQ